MQKRTKRIDVDCIHQYSLDGLLEVTIDKLQKLLEQVPEEYRSSVQMDHDFDCEYEIYYDRIETDEEFEVRINREDSVNKKKEESEKEQLKKLLAKYGAPDE